MKFSYRRMQRALSEKDETELHKLYIPCHEDLMLYCLGKFKDIELAQDAASETLRMLLEHPNPAAIPNLKAWLLTVAKHACLKVITTQERRAGILDKVGQWLNKQQEAEVEEQLDQEHLLNVLRDLLEERDFTIWQLDRQGYKDAEIAKKLNMSAKTAANRKSMIKKILKQKISLLYGCGIFMSSIIEFYSRIN